MEYNHEMIKTFKKLKINFGNKNKNKYFILEDVLTSENIQPDSNDFKEAFELLETIHIERTDLNDELYEIKDYIYSIVN